MTLELSARYSRSSTCRYWFRTNCSPALNPHLILVRIRFSPWPIPDRIIKSWPPDPKEPPIKRERMQSPRTTFFYVEFPYLKSASLPANTTYVTKADAVIMPACKGAWARVLRFFSAKGNFKFGLAARSLRMDDGQGRAPASGVVAGAVLFYRGELFPDPAAPSAGIDVSR